MKKITFLLVIACASTCSTYAQTSGASMNWHKTISREIVLSDTSMINNKKKQDVGANQNLAEMLIQAVISGKAHGYKYDYSGNFTGTIDPKYLKEIMSGPSDTMNVVDPVTGKSVQRVITRDPDYNGMDRFSILEDWTMNKTTGKVSMQIIAIGPKRAVYGMETHELRGYQTVTWIKYEEAAPYLQKFEASNPNANLFLKLWNDILVEN